MQISSINNGIKANPFIQEKKAANSKDFSSGVSLKASSPLMMDKLSFSATPSISPEKPITLKEGGKLFYEGAKEKLKDMTREVKEHPIRTLSLSALATVGISALTILNLPMAVGSAGLALGFSMISGACAAKDTYDIVTETKNGEFNKARESIKDLGGNSVDLALLLPFIPKGVSQFKQAVKAEKAFKINTGLLNAVKHAPNIGEKFLTVLRANGELVAGISKNTPQIPGYLNPILNRAPMLKEGISNFLIAEEPTVATVSSAIGVNATSTMVAQRAKEMGVDDKFCQSMSQKALQSLTEYIKASPAKKLMDLINPSSSAQSIK